MAGSLSRMASWLALVGILFLIALLFSMPQNAEAHSGGLNSQGCHAGSQPYHCHRPQGQAGSTGSTGSTGSSGQRRVISGVITSVRDGDTFLLGNLPIRLAAVDCPETNTQAGRRAAQFLRQYTSSLGSHVNLQVPPRMIEEWLTALSKEGISVGCYSPIPSAMCGSVTTFGTGIERRQRTWAFSHR